MHSKCDAGVEARLHEAERQGRVQEIPVIVTLRPESDWQLLRPHGLQVEHVFAALHAVAGRVRTSHVREIAALDWVLRIEFDGEVRALQDDHS